MLFFLVAVVKQRKLIYDYPCLIVSNSVTDNFQAQIIFFLEIFAGVNILYKIFLCLFIGICICLCIFLGIFLCLCICICICLCLFSGGNILHKKITFFLEKYLKKISPFFFFSRKSFYFFFAKKFLFFLQKIFNFFTNFFNFFHNFLIFFTKVVHFFQIFSSFLKMSLNFCLWPLTLESLPIYFFEMRSYHRYY